MAEIALKDAKKLIGEETYSDWLEITQERVNTFADATNDHQWIHVDVERAKQAMGGTIAHGFLTLSLLAGMPTKGGTRVTGVSRGINYGLNKVRFTSMVPVGSKVRVKSKVIGVEERGGGAQVTRECTMEVDGQDRPAMVAEWISMMFP
ncbi:MAG TPA: MaoC family dehydratase [Caulobacterales bacterium]|nr:MaoC family dehydratase [Caulobacterales bacterium]